MVKNNTNVLGSIDIKGDRCSSASRKGFFNGQFIDDKFTDAGFRSDYIVKNWEREGGRYYADIIFTLEGGDDHAQKWFTKSRRVNFSFDVKVTTGGDSVGFIDSPGAVSQNAMVGVENYEIIFASPACSSLQGRQAGMWDPDKKYPSKLRLLVADKSGSDWNNLSTSRYGVSNLKSAGSTGWRPTIPISGSRALFTGFDMPRDQKFKLQLATERLDLVSLSWPGSTIDAYNRCWDVSPTTTTDKSEAQIGDIVTWSHRVTADKGKDSTDKLSVVLDHVSSSDSGWRGASSLPVRNKVITAGGSVQYEESYRVKASDAGKKLCSRIIVSPGSPTSPSKHSGSMCVNVQSGSGGGGSLNPEVSADKEVVSPGEDVDVSGRIDLIVVNTGDSIRSDWILGRFTLSPLESMPMGGDSLDTQSVFFGRPVDEIDKGDSYNFDKDWNTKLTDTIDEGLGYGSKVCWVLSVNPPTIGSTDWRHSDPVCVTVAKKPKVQVWGGNLSVGKSFGGVLNRDASVQGLISAVKGNSLGSWIEYSILAPGKVSGVASGSALAGTEGSSSSALSDWNRLTYANTDFKTGESYGYYDTRDSSLPDPSGLAEKYGLATGDVAGGTYDIQTLRAGANRVVKLDGSGILTIGGADNTLAKGEWLVVDVPNSDVVIADNVSYTTEGMASMSDLPQLVIRAKNITINGGVTNIDAWLVAGETIKTCDKTDDLTINDCNQPLRVNGPVISKSLVLARTAGENNDPAEVFNLRPDVYLWMYNLANSYTDYRVDSIRELPPRY